MRNPSPSLCCLALTLGLASFSFAAQPSDDIVIRAMRDEISRSMQKLQLENLEKPYFISYQVIDSDGASATGTFGSLEGVTGEQRSRILRVQVRVGSYQFDNRNFFSYSAGNGVSRYGYTALLPLDDNYDEIRRQLWLVTDSVYKKALEDIAKKRALLANKNRGEVIPDFLKEPPVALTDTLPAVPIDIPKMDAMVRDLSGLFKDSPAIATSSVSLSISNELVRYVNSEGSVTTSRQPEIQLFIATASQATDGQPLAANFGYRTRTLSGLPTRAEVAEKIRLRSQEIADLRKAPLPDRYAGPILFEGEAAAEVVFQRFMSHLFVIPEILVDNPQYRSYVAPDSENLVEKIGLRVLPEFLSLADDPTAKSSGASPFWGNYKFDDQAVPTRRMQLVDNGLLMKLLTGRAPVQGILESSGSFHSGGVAPSNIIVTSNKSLTQDALRAELLRRAKLRGKDFGIIVRKVDSSTRNGDNAGMAPGSMAVLLAYKHFTDGHEELLRNAIVNGITFGSFKDILAVSDTPFIWTVSFTPRTMNPLEPAGSNFVSLSVPSLLFEDATVQKPTGNVNKPPFLDHPYFTKK